MTGLLAIILAIFLCYPAADFWARRIAAWIDKRMGDWGGKDE